MFSKYSGNTNIPADQLPQGMPGNSSFQGDPYRIKRKVWLIVISVFIPFLLFIGMIGTFLFFPYKLAGIMEMFDQGPIKGTLLDLTYVPDESGGGKIWVVTNPSFTYIETVETPGRYSRGTACSGCKIRVYIFDPKTEIVEKQWDIPLQGLPTTVELYRHENAVWMSARKTNDFDPFIYKYDAKTGAEVFNTDSFRNEFTGLTAPIIELAQLENPSRYKLKLSDGKEMFFSIDDSVLYSDEQESAGSDTERDVSTVFVLAEDTSAERQKLFSITGSTKEIKSWDCDTYFKSAENLKSNCAAARQLSEEVFLEPLVTYQDSDMVVILYQDNLGRNANRLLSAYNKDGKKLWSIPQERLFEEIKFDSQDSTTSIFMIKSHISAERSGNVFVFIVNKVGAIGIDTQTGVELWRIKT